MDDPSDDRPFTRSDWRRLLRNLHEDPDRPGLRDHMGFGKGVHACLGAPLGRMESRIAIEHLLKRTRAIRISERHHGPADARSYRFEPTYTFRSLSDLHIEFDPA